MKKVLYSFIIITVGLMACGEQKKEEGKKKELKNDEMKANSPAEENMETEGVDEIIDEEMMEMMEESVEESIEDFEDMDDMEGGGIHKNDAGDMLEKALEDPEAVNHNSTRDNDEK